jgi:carboxypeptidase T
MTAPPHRGLRRALARGALLVALCRAALLPAAAAHAVPGPDGSGPWMVRAWFGDAAAIREVAAWGDHLQVERDQGSIRLLADAEQWTKLAALGFFVEVDEAATALLRRAQSAAAAPAPADGERPRSIPGFPCYRTVEETYAGALALANAHPTLASIVDVGDSWDKSHPPDPPAGYDLLVLRLTNSAIPGPKPVLLVSAALHAREYTTAEAALRFAEWLVGARGVDADATWVLDHHEIHILLQANPDGRKAAESGNLWRKNRNDANGCASTFGVDLNRNFDFFWGAWGGSSGAACSETYRGASAGSEPETQTLAAYMSTVFADRRPDDLTTAAPDDTAGLFVDLHSFANEILSVWGQTPSAVCDGAPPTWPPNCAQLLRLGRKWAYLSGFDPRVGSLYPVDGSTKDFVYGHLGVPGYTWEMGTNFFESCADFAGTVLPDALAMLRYAMRVPRTPYLTPAGPDIVAATAPSAPVAVGQPALVQATADDTRFLDPDGVEPSQPIAAAEVYVDSPPWAGGSPSAMLAGDGTFDSVVETVTLQLETAGLAPGRHLLYLRGQDGAGNWGAVSGLFLDLFDPASVLFLDGFASGDLSRWSSATP